MSVSHPPILAVETASNRGGVALRQPDGSIVERVWATRGRHCEMLGPGVLELLNAVGLKTSDLGAISVGLGPGSFTGLRIGLTFAKTLAFLDSCPLYAFSGLQVRALQAWNQQASVIQGLPVLVADKAHADGFYAAIYKVGPQGAEVVKPPFIASADDLLGLARDRFLVSDDSDLLGRCSSPKVELEEGASPGLLSALGGEALARGDVSEDPRNLEPLYLQPAAADRIAARVSRP